MNINLRIEFVFENVLKNIFTYLKQDINMVFRKIVIDLFGILFHFFAKVTLFMTMMTRSRCSEQIFTGFVCCIKTSLSRPADIISHIGVIATYPVQNAHIYFHFQDQKLLKLP